MITTISTAQIILWSLVLAWLGACAVCDLRSRQVPGWLTIPPLILAGGHTIRPGKLAASPAAGGPDTHFRPASIQMAHTLDRFGCCSSAFRLWFQ